MPPPESYIRKQAPKFTIKGTSSALAKYASQLASRGEKHPFQPNKYQILFSQELAKGTTPQVARQKVKQLQKLDRKKSSAAKKK